VRGKSQNSADLVPRHAELFHRLVDIHVLKVFEHRRNGYPRAVTSKARWSYSGAGVAVRGDPPTNRRRTAHDHGSLRRGDRALWRKPTRRPLIKSCWSKSHPNSECKQGLRKNKAGGFFTPWQVVLAAKEVGQACGPARLRLLPAE
jgi:hypothetical protein